MVISNIFSIIIIETKYFKFMSYYVTKVQIIDEIDTPRGVKSKKITESYLVEAMSVTEAEAKVIKDFEGYSVPFEVKGITQSKIIKIID